MSDAIDRDAVEAILRRRVDGCYGDCTTQCLSCAAKEDIEEIRSLPAVPPAAERRNCIRLRIDKDDTMGVTIWHGTARVWMDGDSLSGEEWASTDLASVVRWIRAQTDQFTAAFRAAKPDSTGAAPPAAEPGVTRTRCTIIQTAPTPLQFDAEEPAVEPAPDLPWGTDIGPSDYMTPAAEPAIFQKPPGSCDEGSVRCNNPEPAAQPFRHGRCCAEEPKEPAPCVGTNCANPRCNYMVPCGMICNKCGSIAAKAACSACRAKEPAPCGRCGGSGSVWDGLKGVHVSDGNAMKPCPSCSPGGGA